MIWLKVLAPTVGAIRAYRRAGFQHAGALRRSGYWLGGVCDEIVVGALDAEFEDPSAIKTLLSLDQR